MMTKSTTTIKASEIVALPAEAMAQVRCEDIESHRAWHAVYRMATGDTSDAWLQIEARCSRWTDWRTVVAG
jgi:hypothetical protein